MTVEGRAQQGDAFRYCIETSDGRLIGVSAAGPVAFAMFRAAASEFAGQGVALRDRDEVVVRTD